MAERGTLPMAVLDLRLEDEDLRRQAAAALQGTLSPLLAVVGYGFGDLHAKVAAHVSSRFANTQSSSRFFFRTPQKQVARVV
jgi:hypothetical protein